MNLRDLRYLVAVAEDRHFGRAADRCAVSQPTLSTQIKKLEEYLDVAVFERTSKSVEITPAGARIIEEARAAVHHADNIRAIAAELRDPLAGRLEIGAIPTICPYLMPIILQVLRDHAPTTQTVFLEDVTERLESRLRSAEIDAAILATPVTDHEFLELPVFCEPFWLAVPSEDPLATRPDITEDDLNAANLLLLTDGHCLRDQALEVCRQTFRTNDDAGDVCATSLQTLMHMVQAGYGCTLVPALAVPQWQAMDGLVLRPLDLPAARRKVSIVTRKSFPRRKAVELVAHAVRAAVADRVEIIAT